MNIPIKNFVLGGLMICAALSAPILRPTHKLSEARPSNELELIIPQQFGDWHEVQLSSGEIVDPRQKEKIDRIYSKTLARTYVNGDGYKIMLSLAYGTDQTDEKQVHRPEVCYPAQGFAIEDLRTGRLSVASEKSVPVTRLITIQGVRHEPVTYWITIGDQVVLTSLQKKIAELRYVLRKEIADGMLVRFSSIDANSERAFSMQEQFAQQMIAALAPDSQPRFIGNDDRN